MNDSVIQRLADLEKTALQAGFTKADFNTAALFRVIEKFDELTRYYPYPQMSPLMTTRFSAQIINTDCDIKQS